jgi:hypothetical protein
MEIISRKDAKTLGLKRFFTGVPCNHGHISERLVNGKGMCILCENIHKTKWRKNNPEKFRSQMNRWSGYPEPTREIPKVCECCHRPEIVKYKNEIKSLALDHNHSTNEFRGWLCNKCNVMIGYADDSEERLLLGVEYLRKSKNV